MPVRNNQRDIGLLENAKKDDENYRLKHNVAKSSMNLGDRDITAFCGLAVLKKPPLEDYVPSTRKKKHRKRKFKCKKYYPNDESTVQESFLQSSEEFKFSPETLKDLPLPAETLEEKLLNEKTERKIHINEKFIKIEEEKNYRRQRFIEKKEIKELENLAQTWLGIIQRRKELSQKDLEVASVSHKRYYRYRPIDISLISKKIWNDEKDKKISKPFFKKLNSEEDFPKKPSSLALSVLENDFLEKLVFIDDSDDESD